jgi:AcrR family transcriptional regulator
LTDYYTEWYTLDMDNRQNLLDQAMVLFARHGYEGTGVQEIVEAANVTKPTLYHYFGSKAGLLEALLEVHLRHHLKKLREAARYQGDLMMTLRAIVRTGFDFSLTQPTFYQLQLSMWYAAADSEAHQAVLPYIQEQYAILEETFMAAVPDHGNLKGHHQVYALSLKGMLDSYIAFASRGGPTLNEALIYRLVQQFMYGIFSL